MGDDESKCGNCNFESGQCNWSTSNNVGHRWIRKQASDQKLPGPPMDSNLNKTGWYLTVNATTYAGHGLAILYSSKDMYAFKKASYACVMQFKYHVKNQPAGELNIRIFRVGGTSSGSR